MLKNNLKIKEIFYSLQGESTLTGLPTTFVRLTGCPLRCNYCDTAYAFSGGKNMAISEIIKIVQSHPAKYVCITGGEPLAQTNCQTLISVLCDLGYQVSVETSGARDIRVIDNRAITVMDLKTPDSGEQDNNLWTNLQYLKPKDQVKFVICSHSDYLWVKDVMFKFPVLKDIECLASPCYDKVELSSLADWILKDCLNLRLQIQLHKLIWGEQPGT